MSAADSRRRSYWLVLVFAALVLSPPAWAAAALVAGAIGAVALGAARDARARRLAATAVASRGDATVLGFDRGGQPVVLHDRQLSAHGLILGASGAGKSTTLLAILTDHIRRGRPVVAIDMKGSPAFGRELELAAAQAGRGFQLFSPDGPGYWNPLRHGNATELKDKLISTERFTEPHYQRAAERYMQTVLQVLHDAHPGRESTLDEVVAAMDPKRLSTMVRGLPRDRLARVQDYLATLTPDQLSAIRGLGTRLAIISESHTGRFLSPAPDAGPAIDLREALAGGDVVLFSMNSSRYGKLSAQIGTLAVQDLIAAAGDRLSAARGEASRAIVGIDEFSALNAENVISLLARGREADVSVFLATQELADLDRAARGLRDQVLGNTAVKIAHRQDVPSSAETFAQMAGTVKGWQETEQYGGRLFGYGAGRGTRREVERYAVHPNEIKSLRTGEAIVLTKLPHSQVRTVRVARPERDGPELG